MKKILFTISYVFAFFFVTSLTHIHAAEIAIESQDSSFHQGQQFVVNVTIDTQSENINAVDLKIHLPNFIDFIGFQDNDSLISNWVDSPTLSGDHEVTLSGISANGFSNLIDPFAPTTVQSTSIVKLLFVPTKSGTGYISLHDSSVYFNDGAGTEEKVGGFNLYISADDTYLDQKISFDYDQTPPLDFTPLLKKDPTMYNGKYFIIFDTKDKESGIDHYEVKEGNNDWKTAKSPYSLTDQTLAGTIVIRAIDKAGNTKTATITDTRINTKGSNIIAFLILIVLCLLLFRKKVMQKLLKDR